MAEAAYSHRLWASLGDTQSARFRSQVAIIMAGLVSELAPKNPSNSLSERRK